MKLSREQREALLRLTSHDGWQVLLGLVAEREQHATRRLADQDFAQLLEVGRLQGELRAYRWLKEVAQRAGEVE